jgi:hypothetical protein
MYTATIGAYGLILPGEVLESSGKTLELRMHWCNIFVYYLGQITLSFGTLASVSIKLGNNMFYYCSGEFCERLFMKGQAPIGTPHIVPGVIIFGV